MTVYNRERYVGEAIASVLAQTDPDFEFIVWDDGSTDRSLTIAQAWSQQDSRIKVIAAAHQGRALALQQAHAIATGEYVAWVDSDDWLAPQAVAKTRAILETKPEIGMVYTNYHVIDGNGRTKGLGNRHKVPYSKERLLVDFMTFHFRLMRRSRFEQVGGINPTFPCALDYDLCLKLSEVTEVYHLAEPLYAYREHSASISFGQRLEQIEYSQRAINQALERRGLSDRYTLQVEIIGRFSLHRH